tara:strand:+ start:551 stop:829 length:279 start_codon:yes stop_codon:yes gene_type:complete
MPESVTIFWAFGWGLPLFSNLPSVIKSKLIGIAVMIDTNVDCSVAFVILLFLRECGVIPALDKNSMSCLFKKHEINRNLFLVDKNPLSGIAL